MLKLKLCQFLTTFILIPFVAIFVILFTSGHSVLAFVWVFAAAALSVFVEDTFKRVKRKFKHKH